MRNLDKEWEIIRIPAEYMPRYVAGGIKETLEFIMDERKRSGMYRDTRSDDLFLMEHYNLYTYPSRQRRHL